MTKEEFLQQFTDLKKQVEALVEASQAGSEPEPDNHDQEQPTEGSFDGWLNDILKG